MPISPHHIKPETHTRNAGSFRESPKPSSEPQQAFGYSRNQVLKRSKLSGIPETNF
jgi:hypothetical protein